MKDDMFHCDNFNDVHEPKELQDTKEIVEVFCTKCKAHEYFRKTQAGRVGPEYSSFFRKHSLQPSQNLYYKAYPNRMLVEGEKYVKID